MESIIFHVDADTIGPNFGESIKAYFGNRRVQITVKPEETPADDEFVRDGANDRDYALPYDDIARISGALERNEPIDMAAEMKKFMEAK